LHFSGEAFLPSKVHLAAFATREEDEEWGQLKALVEAIRNSDGRPGSQAKAKNGADLVELLAFSGCRLGEARALRWHHVNLDQNRLTVPGTKSDSSRRVIPISAPLRELLLRLQKENTAAGPLDPIMKHKSARKCLETACRKLGFPRFTHHSTRHFFCTCAIESGVDIPTVSRWLGHKDGGQLAMKVYAHLRATHSDSMISQVSFEQRQKIVPMQAA
jgi:integrase